MINRIRSLILILFLTSTLLLLQQSQAEAWKPHTHVYAADQVWTDAVLDGRVNIAGVDYAIRPEIVAALSDWPEYYNAGVIGPDGFPGIVFGQSILHPENTGAWLRYVLSSAWRAQSDPSYTPDEKSQILAFAYGFLTHAAGDTWGHSLVNDFAQEIFPPIIEIVTDEEMAKVVLRHIIVEGYVAGGIPGYDTNPERGTAPNGDVSGDSTPGILFDAPHRFIFETLIDPQNGAPSHDRGVLIDQFLALRGALQAELGSTPSAPLETLVQELDRAEENLRNMRLAARAAREACDISRHPEVLVPSSNDNKNCLSALNELGITNVNAFGESINGAIKAAEESSELTAERLKDGYIAAWIEDIDTGLEHWSELGLAITNGLFDPQSKRDLENEICRFTGGEETLLRADCESAVRTIDVINALSQDYINDYMLAMLGLPDSAGGVRAAMQQYSDDVDLILAPLQFPLNPILEADAQISKFADQMINDAIARRFGIDVEQIEEFVTHPTHWMNAESEEISLPVVGTVNVDLFSAGDHARLDEFMGIEPGHHVPSNFPRPGGSTRLADGVVVDPNEFPPLRNTITIGKILLLDAAGLNQLLGDVLVGAGTIDDLASVTAYQDGDVVPANVMVDGLDGSPWLLSIDSDHAWRVDGKPRFPNRDPGVLPHGGSGQFPLWESCLLRPAFRALFVDWENEDNADETNFPDLGDACSVVSVVPLAKDVPPARVPPDAAFDWSMPDRFGDDANGDGLIDYYTTSIESNKPVADLIPIGPDGSEIWRVDFDACNSTPGDGRIIRYEWEIDGARQPAARSCSGFSHNFPEEGAYQVKLTVSADDGLTSQFTQEVVVQDWLIVSFGDSYASGEGSPDISAGYTAGSWRTSCSLDSFGIVPGFQVENVCYSVPPLGIPGVVTPPVPSTCVGVVVNRECWAVPPTDGIPGVMVPGTPRTCNADPDGFDSRGNCWLVPPTDGVFGVVTPAVASACNGNPDGFDRNGECWTTADVLGVPGIATPAISAKCNGGTGTFQGGQCWTTVPYSIEGYQNGFWTSNVCVPIGDLDIGFIPSSNCDIDVAGIPGVTTPAIAAACNGNSDGFDNNGDCWTIAPVIGIPGLVTPALPATCNGSKGGFDRNGQCWIRIPTTGFVGVIVEAIPATCNGGLGTFIRRDCWTVPPGAGVPGFKTPAVPRTCNGDPAGFDRSGQCWTTPPGSGSTQGTFIVDSCFMGPDSPLPGIVVPFGGTPSTGAECLAIGPGSSPEVEPIWQDDYCHRSAKSGHAQAALSMENNDPRTSVTFVHLACSGSQIFSNMAFLNLADQIEEANKLIGDREIDAVLLSIGGNDAGFASVVKACILQELCFEDDFTTLGSALSESACLFAIPFEKLSDCVEFVTDVGGEPGDSSGQRLFFNALYGVDCLGQGTPSNGANGCQRLLSRYDSFKKEVLINLAGVLPEELREAKVANPEDPNLPDVEEIPDLQRQDRIFLVEYPDLTKDDRGFYCDPQIHVLPLQVLPGGSRPESVWADTVAIEQLDQGVAQGAEAAGWNLVDGIYSGFKEHGYCAYNHWVVRMQESLVTQLDHLGSVHPNQAGYEFYGQRIAEDLTTDFYRGGNLAFPRIPDSSAQVERINTGSRDVIVRPPANVQGGEIRRQDGRRDSNNQRSGETITIALQPTTLEASPSEEVSIDVDLDPSKIGISSIALKLEFDGSQLELRSVEPGKVMGSRAVVGRQVIDSRNGTLLYSLSRRGPSKPPTSAGQVVRLHFKVLDRATPGSTRIRLLRFVATDENSDTVTDVSLVQPKAVINITRNLFLGDINQDGVVNHLDLAILGSAQGFREGAPRFDPRADLNSDGSVGLDDFSLLGSNYGKKAR